MIHSFIHLFKQIVTPHTMLCSCELYMFIQLLINSTNVFNCYFETCFFFQVLIIEQTELKSMTLAFTKQTS